MTSMVFEVQSDNTKISEEFIHSQYSYTKSEVSFDYTGKKFIITPNTTNYEFRTRKKIPRLGVMLIGLGGNNGTTVVGGILANSKKITWNNKKGEQSPNFYGSVTQCSTTKIGTQNNEEVFLPIKDILPMVDPCDIVISGWDISSLNLEEAMKRAQVFDYDLQRKLAPYMKEIKPLPGVYYPDFIALNQGDRADYILKGNSKWDHVQEIRRNINDFKNENQLEKVIVFWTANTERMCYVQNGVHDSSKSLLSAIKSNHKEISPSTIYAVASVMEGCSFINGSPQNTIVPGVIELAEEKGVFVVGNDFKSGQTKFKTLFTEFLVQAGIKPLSIVSYNHLGNNDGKNLSSESQFKSKEKSKSSCVDDILYSNQVLFPKREPIDHCVVIKYIPATGDSKKALDEYMSEIFMGGQHVLSTYNVCEDSLLAAPLIIDLILLTELFDRIEIRKGLKGEFIKFDTILDLLGYFTKAPLTREGLGVINSLARQRNTVENFLKVCAGIPLETNLLLERRVLDIAKAF